jgi:phosphate uptake regulator
MTDRPDFDPEKTFATIRDQWTKESHLSLPSKLEQRLTLIEEQLSALFQLAQKALGDQIDAAIDRDFKNTKLEELFVAIIALEKRVGKLETK